MVYFDAVDRSTGEVVDESLIFNIRIRDVNDHAPQFAEKEFNITVKESQASGQPIFQLLTVDLDQENTPNSQVLYFLVSQTPLLRESGFRIDLISGEVRLSGCLNYETAPWFTLVIRATDCGEPSLSSTAIIHISVEEGNNHMPTFMENHYRIQISEGQVEWGVLYLPVQDQDSPFTAAWRTQFHILGGNEEEHFDIMTDPETNQGVLNVIKPLDYETQAAHSLIIVVENQEQLFSCEEGQPQPSTKAMASATVSIHVVDTNDPPAFHPRSFIVSEEDGARPGIRLGAFNATDPDRVASQIRYKLVHDPADWMIVDERSGVVTTKRQIDRESPHVNDSFYTVTVHAVDNGGRSAELLMLRSLPPGDYLVPLFIADRQGLTQKQTVHVRVCSCPSGSECENRSDVRLLWWALSPVCAALAVLAAALLCLLRCHFAFGPKRLRGSIPSENGHQTLIVYNEESKALSAQMQPTGEDQMPVLSFSTAMSSARPDVKKLHAVDVLDSDTGYQPHVYREEGEYEGAETLSSLTVLEQDLSPELPDCLT
ncbi:cadherin-like 26 [Cricetulus griseus]